MDPALDHRAHPGTVPAWVEHAVAWHLYPLGFVGAPATAEKGAVTVPRLGALLPWLDYLLELGANVLMLGPVFRSHTHGYDTVDHFAVDPRLGTTADLDELIAQAHVRGIRVVLDGVFNHVGRGFPSFREAQERGPQAPAADWFRWRREGVPEVFEGHEGLVRLNHSHPDVVDYVVSVLRYWCQRGVDGWRLDAAYAVPQRFWASVTARVRADFPAVWLYGEMIHGDYAAVVRATGLHSVTQYELWKAVWSSLNDRNLFELAHAIERHLDMLEVFVPQTFVGNHDVTRLASQLTDLRHLPQALVVLFTVGGVPSLYAGDEQGFTGVKEHRVGGDDALRPAFPASPDQLPAEGEPTLRLHQQLIALRRRHPWLHRAGTGIEHLTNTALVYRSYNDHAQELVVALNVADEPLNVALPPGGWTIEAGTAETTRGCGRCVLPPHGWAVFGPHRST